MEKMSDKDVVLSLFLSNLYSKYLTNEALEGFADFKAEGQLICTVTHADDFVLLGKKEMLLQSKTD
jgi:hypothetical protein